MGVALALFAEGEGVRPAGVTAPAFRAVCSSGITVGGSIVTSLAARRPLKLHGLNPLASSPRGKGGRHRQREREIDRYIGVNPDAPGWIGCLLGFGFSAEAAKFFVGRPQEGI